MIKIFLAVAVVIVIGCNDNKIKSDAEPLSEGKITVINDAPKDTDNVSRFITYGVTGEYRVSVAPDGIETPETKEVGAHLVIRNQPYASIHKSLLAKRLSKEFIVKCSACHDNYANGVIGPSLLMKTGDEIYDIIVKYKSKKDSNVLMKVLVDKMSDDEIRFISNDIAKFNKEVRGE